MPVQTNPMTATFRALPKIELHRHLEGSLRLSTMCEIAHDYDLDLPHDAPEAFSRLVQVNPGEAHTFSNFLSKFSTLRQLYRSPEVIQRITREAIEDAAADNVRYMELRFTPVALTRVQGCPLRDAIEWVSEAAAQAAEEHDIDVRLIVSANRHESVALAEEAFQHAVDFQDHGVVGVDLAGDEIHFPGEDFAPVFAAAAQAGLHITIHAGESGPADRLQLAIETLGAERIGHGVRVMEDTALVDQCREREIVFEVCPTSNLHTGVVPALRTHPLKAMRAAGLRVTLNTDDPSISQIDLSNEYQVATDILDIDGVALHEMTLLAAEAAFLPRAEKLTLIQQIKDTIHNHNETVKEQ